MLQAVDSFGNLETAGGLSVAFQLLGSGGKDTFSKVSERASSTNVKTDVPVTVYLQTEDSAATT